jgi:hypothetical protein
MAREPKRALAHTLLYGAVSVLLYYLLYRYDALILEYSKQGGWFFIIPITIAFAFSVVHGNFTGRFWDLFGVKAKTTKK